MVGDLRSQASRGLPGCHREVHLPPRPVDGLAPLAWLSLLVYAGYRACTGCGVTLGASARLKPQIVLSAFAPGALLRGGTCARCPWGRCGVVFPCSTKYVAPTLHRQWPSDQGRCGHPSALTSWGPVVGQARTRTFRGRITLRSRFHCGLSLMDDPGNMPNRTGGGPVCATSQTQVGHGRTTRERSCL